MEPIGPHGVLSVDMTTDSVVVLKDTAADQKVSMTADEVGGFVCWLDRARGLDRREDKPLDAVLTAARALLETRNVAMDTVMEWTAMARAVAGWGVLRVVRVVRR